ncbi:MAG: reverse transcriptase domain-containing protein [Saprospiraceae bacterium]
MKRVGNLMPQIASLENLQLAHYKAKKGKESKPEVWAFSKDLNSNLKQLQTQILSGQVEVGNYHYFTIYDPKERRICAAAYPERVLHHALMNVCSPYFEAFQISDSYATRIDKGTFKAIDRAWGFQKQYRYYLKLDIRKYFDSIDHDILLSMLHRKFKDKALLDIFSEIIHSYSVLPGKGVPIGNLTSQFFANHYLALLDHFIKDELQVKAYIRYMDDFVIWQNNKNDLQFIQEQVLQFISANLSLNLKTNYLNTCAHGLPFLGFRLFPEKILLSVRSKKRFKQKIARLDEQLASEEIAQEQYQLQATAIYAFVNKAYSNKLKRSVLLVNDAIY